MAQNFIPCDRDQELLLAPNMRDWLPEDHLAWFVIESVEALELSAFYGAYRADGHGAAAHDPQMMVALTPYAYATGERSSRRIECRCREDVAYRVISASRVPDHATIARFRARHQDALAALFTQVLGLCVGAGIASPAVLAVDGTKLAADACAHQNKDYEEIAREIIREAGRIDAEGDELYGSSRGEELPEELSTRRGRQEWIREALRRHREEREAGPEPIPRGRAQRAQACRSRLAAEHRTEWRPTATTTKSAAPIPAAARPSLLSRPPSPPARSTSPTPAPGRCAPPTASCRAITPRR